MTKTKSTDVATIEKTDAELPAYLQGVDMSKEDDNFDSSDIVIPRIKLLQGLSTEIEQYEHAKIGNFWHTGLDMDLGNKITFIVADRRKKFLLSAPLADGQGILARADDAMNWDRVGEWQVKLKGVKKPVDWIISNTNVEKSGLTKWGTSNPDDEDSPPAATLFYDYLVFLPEMPELGMAVITLARSSIRAAKKGLNDKIAMHRQNGRPMQALKFSAESVDDVSDDGPYKNWLFKSAGFNMDEKLFNQLTEYRGALANLKIKDEDGDRTEDSSPADTGEGDY